MKRIILINLFISVIGGLFLASCAGSSSSGGDGTTPPPPSDEGCTEANNETFKFSKVTTGVTICGNTITLDEKFVVPSIKILDGVTTANAKIFAVGLSAIADDGASLIFLVPADTVLADLTTKGSYDAHGDISLTSSMIMNNDLAMGCNTGYAGNKENCTIFLPHTSTKATGDEITLEAKQFAFVGFGAGYTRALLDPIDGVANDQKPNDLADYNATQAEDNLKDGLDADEVGKLIAAAESGQYASHTDSSLDATNGIEVFTIQGKVTVGN